MQINAGPNTLNVTMTATVQTGTLSGTVTDANSQPISGVSVSMTGASVNTDSNGVYTITGIPVVTYTVTFSKTGYTTVTK